MRCQDSGQTVCGRRRGQVLGPKVLLPVAVHAAEQRLRLSIAACRATEARRVRSFRLGQSQPVLHARSPDPAARCRARNERLCLGIHCLQRDSGLGWLNASDESVRCGQGVILSLGAGRRVRSVLAPWPRHRCLQGNKGQARQVRQTGPKPAKAAWSPGVLQPLLCTRRNSIAALAQLQGRKGQARRVSESC